jgi:hypothetical protein
MGPFELADYVGKKYTDIGREESEFWVSSRVRLQGGNSDGNSVGREGFSSFPSLKTTCHRNCQCR